MRNFRELEIWKEAIDLVTTIYSFTNLLPIEEKFGLVSQMNRSAVSIASNIAEGCRGTNKELIHFLNLALGSSFELETQLEITKRVGFIETGSIIEIIEELNLLQKRINAFRKTVKG